MKDSKIVQTDKSGLPYERFQRSGSDSLTDPELLSILLQTGSGDKNVLELASQVMETIRYYGPGLTGLAGVPFCELKKLEGIGTVKAIRLQAVAEISKRIWQTDAHNRLVFSSPSTIAAYYREQLRYEQVEKVILLVLDTRMGYLGEKVLTEGTVNASLISPRELFIYALQMQAVHMILLHNHPSGDEHPSKQDIQITERISELGKMMDVDLLDHIIIGGLHYYSFKEQGLLQ